MGPKEMAHWGPKVKCFLQRRKQRLNYRGLRQYGRRLLCSQSAAHLFVMCRPFGVPLA